jgi:hypothetical protein
MENTSHLSHSWLIYAGIVALLLPAATAFGDDPSAEKPPAQRQATLAVKRAGVGKNIVLETQGNARRVRIAAEVCFREGPLEMLMCRTNTKEHESVLHADIDARQVHAALLLAGAKPGSPVRYEPKYTPATGTTIKVTLEYKKDGKTVTVPGQEWVRDAKTRKAMPHPWVFAGSVFFPNQEDPTKPPFYAANGGDVICISNFPDAMLDLPVNSPQEDADRLYEAFTDHIPPLGTPVTIVLEPVAEKK